MLLKKKKQNSAPDCSQKEYKELSLQIPADDYTRLMERAEKSQLSWQDYCSHLLTGETIFRRIATATQDLFQRRMKVIPVAFWDFLKVKLSVSHMVFFYAFLVTAFISITSNAFFSDLQRFVDCIWEAVCFGLGKIAQLAGFVAQLGDFIPFETVANNVRWLLFLTVLIGLIVLACRVFFGVGKKIVRIYKKDYGDNIGLTVFLVSFAVVVLFGDAIRAVLPINLIFVIGILQLLYVFLRWCSNGSRR